MSRLSTSLRIADWEEKPTAENADGSKVTRATVALAEGPEGLESGTFESVMYYRPDGTSRYVNVMQLAATLDGRSGTFVAIGEGGFDGTTASGESTIVEGSGTGGLAGITGTVRSASTHDDYPHMPLELDYRLP